MVLPFEFVIDRSPPCRDDIESVFMIALLTLQNSTLITEDLLVVLSTSILGPENDMVHCVTKSSEDFESSDHPLILRPRYTAFQPANIENKDGFGF